MNYPRIRATMIQPGCIVLNASLIPNAGADPIPVVIDQSVDSVEEAHAILRELSAERGIPPELVEIDTDGLNLL